MMRMRPAAEVQRLSRGGLGVRSTASWHGDNDVDWSACRTRPRHMSPVQKASHQHTILACCLLMVGCASCHRLMRARTS
jgi:hypothetical protein